MKPLVLSLFLSWFLFADIPWTQFQFEDQEGKKFCFTDLKGKYVFISFIFTRCPHQKMCPLTVTLTKNLYKEWKKMKKNIPLEVVLVTLEPSFDNPKVLKKYAKSWDLNLKIFHLIRSDEKTISDFSSYFNVITFQGNKTLNHVVKSVLIGPNQNIVSQYKDNEWKASDVIKDLSK